MTGPKHSCGVVGIKADFDVAPAMYMALMIIQHRGQESAGITVFSDGSMETVKGNGLVDRAIPKDDLVKLRGKVGLGHVRYSAAGQKDVENAQPLVATSKFGSIAVAHNGDITNSEELLIQKPCRRNFRQGFSVLAYSLLRLFFCYLVQLYKTPPLFLYNLF